MPGSVRNWTYSRFQDKVNKIGKVILAAGKEQVPDLVGLCEVENDYCLKSLTRYSPLREVGYKYVMTSSPDERGIDVALLYQPVSFRLLASQKIRIPSDSLGMRPTRDVLYVSGLAHGIRNVFRTLGIPAPRLFLYTAWVDYRTLRNRSYDFVCRWFPLQIWLFQAVFEHGWSADCQL